MNMLTCVFFIVWLIGMITSMAFIINEYYDKEDY